MHADWINGRRVLVTGGAGFIGSWLVRKLVNMGCDVVVADNLSRGSVSNLATVVDRISLRTLDLTNLQNCNEVAKDVDCIFHLASAVGGVQYIRARNVDNLTPSVLMNANMAEAARKSGAERFLFTSSACVYHDKNASLNRFKEIDAYPANPPTTYGWAKVFGELLCKAYHDDYGMKTSAARIFNAYGEGENLEPRWSHVIPSLIRKAILHPSEDFTVFGDGSQERAFLYVDDCVQGLLEIMIAVENGEPVNLGSDAVTSVGQVAQTIVKISGKSIRIVFDRSGPKGVNRYCPDLGRMEALTGWKPSTSLESGLRRTYAWARSRLAEPLNQGSLIAVD